MVADLSLYPQMNDRNYYALSQALWTLGIESIFGPNWPIHLGYICMLLGEESEECIQLRGLSLGLIHENGQLVGK